MHAVQYLVRAEPFVVVVVLVHVQPQRAVGDAVVLPRIISSFTGTCTCTIIGLRMRVFSFSGSCPHSSPSSSFCQSFFEEPVIPGDRTAIKSGDQVRQSFAAAATAHIPQPTEYANHSFQLPAVPHELALTDAFLRNEPGIERRFAGGQGSPILVC